MLIISVTKYNKVVQPMRSQLEEKVMQSGILIIADHLNEGTYLYSLPFT